MPKLTSFALDDALKPPHEGLSPSSHPTACSGLTLTQESNLSLPISDAQRHELFRDLAQLLMRCRYLRIELLHNTSCVASLAAPEEVHPKDVDDLVAAMAFLPVDEHTGFPCTAIRVLLNSPAVLSPFGQLELSKGYFIPTPAARPDVLVRELCDTLNESLHPMTQIISTPASSDKFNHFDNKKLAMAYYQTIGRRDTQEDALFWQRLNQKALALLTPMEVAQRLLVAYYELNHHLRDALKGRKYLPCGSTASTTVVMDNVLITATLGAVSAFVFFFDEAGVLLAVERINTREHKPTDSDEMDRMYHAGGGVAFLGSPKIPYVFATRTLDKKSHGLATSRAFGDFDMLAPTGTSVISASPHLSIVELPKSCHHAVYCGVTAGTTDMAKIQDKKGQEDALFKALRGLNAGRPGLLSLKELGQELAIKAHRSRRTRGDNNSLLLQTLVQNGKPCINSVAMGVFDGHGSNYIATQLAANMGEMLNIVVEASKEDYAASESYRAIAARDAMLSDHDLSCTKLAWVTTSDGEQGLQRSEHINSAGAAELGLFAMRHKETPVCAGAGALAVALVSTDGYGDGLGTTSSIKPST